MDGPAPPIDSVCDMDVVGQAQSLRVLGQGDAQVHQGDDDGQRPQESRQCDVDGDCFYFLSRVDGAVV
jgi:hypothetical protein